MLHNFGKRLSKQQTVLFSLSVGVYKDDENILLNANIYETNVSEFTDVRVEAMDFIVVYHVISSSKTMYTKEHNQVRRENKFMIN